jgi:DNA polymerase III subunit delta'
VSELEGDPGDPDAEIVDPWVGLVGQSAVARRLEKAAEAPVHAYLLVGQPGSGTVAAAFGFAALLLSAGLDGPAAARARRLALGSRHPDLVIVEAEGAALRVEEANEIIRAGQTSPIEGSRKVIVVHGIDVIQEAAVGKLLKLIEEPPPSMVFVLLAEAVPPEIVTIASRCVSIELGALSRPVLEAALVAAGVSPGRAKVAAAASGGDLDRARLLAADDALAARADLWRTVPARVDGRGVTVWELVNQIREAMDGAQEPLVARQQTEIRSLDERVAESGERGSGRPQLIARHKREVRRLRADELRFGLATLARVYRDRLVDAADPQAEMALVAIQDAAESLVRNPNETLSLQALLLKLGQPAVGAREGVR